MWNNQQARKVDPIVVASSCLFLNPYLSPTINIQPKWDPIQQRSHLIAIWMSLRDRLNTCIFEWETEENRWNALRKGSEKRSWNPWQSGCIQDQSLIATGWPDPIANLKVVLLIMGMDINDKECDLSIVNRGLMMVNDLMFGDWGYFFTSYKFTMSITNPLKRFLCYTQISS